MSEARMAHNARLMTQKMQRKVQHPNGNYDHDEFQFGVVQTIHVGPPPALDVYLDGTQTIGATNYLTMGIPYLAGYVPTVGDVVLVYRGKGRKRSSRLVLGKQNGAASPYPLPLGSFQGGMWIAGPNALWGGAGAPLDKLPGTQTPFGAAGDYFLRTDLAQTYWNAGGSWTLIGPAVLPSSSQPGTAYTLQLGDLGTVVEFTSSAAVTLSIPPNSSVPFPLDAVVQLCQIGTGAVSIIGASGSGVGLQSPGGAYGIGAQFGTVTLRQRVIDTWILSGDV